MFVHFKVTRKCLDKENKSKHHMDLTLRIYEYEFNG